MKYSVIMYDLSYQDFDSLVDAINTFYNLSSVRWIINNESLVVILSRDNKLPFGIASDPNDSRS